MSAAAQDKAKDEEAPKKGGGGKKKLLLVLAVPLLLGGAGAGLWFTGILPPLLGMGTPAAEGEAQAEAATAEAARPLPPRPAVFQDMPEIMTNLNVPGRRPTYVKLRAKLELSRSEDLVPVRAAMPRLVDLFQTYLREMRPEELRGSAGTHRLREELMQRATLAAAPARVTDVLFVELLVQ